MRLLAREHAAAVGPDAGARGLRRGLHSPPPRMSAVPAEKVQASQVDQRESQRRAVEDMACLLRALIGGSATRADAHAFTRELWPDTSKQGGPFPGNGCASTVFDSLWNIDER